MSKAVIIGYISGLVKQRNVIYLDKKNIKTKKDELVNKYFLGFCSIAALGKENLDTSNLRQPPVLATSVSVCCLDTDAILKFSPCKRGMSEL